MKRWIGKRAAWCAAIVAAVGLNLLLTSPGTSPRGGGEDQEHMLGRPIASSGGHVSGSAFAIGPNLVVTNAHVTMRCQASHLPITIGGTDGWQVRAEDPTEELALLVGPPGASLPPLSLSAAPQLSRATPVMLLGYPYSAGSFDRLQATPGKVERAALTVHRPDIGTSVTFIAASPDGTSVDPSWADGVAYFGAKNADKLRWILELTAAAGHGDSGGPVLDANGSLVGVVFAGSPEKDEASAITLDDLRAFLSRNGITPAFAPPADQIYPNWQHAIDKAAPSVLRVGC